MADAHITAQIVLTILSDLSNSLKTREEVEEWADQIIILDELGKVSFEGAYNDNVWDAIKFLSGVALRESENGPYLYGDEDIEETRKLLSNT